MTTEEKNKLIAKFMGGKLVKSNGFGHVNIFNWRMPDGSIFPKGTEGYHEDWSMLMPVVEKIMDYRWPEYYGKRGKTEDYGDFDDCAYLRTFGMRDAEGNYMVRFNASTLFKKPKLIDATYEAVVDFIQWYNQQIK